MFRIDAIIQNLNSLHKKILSSDFTEQVTAPEILSIVYAMQLLHCHRPGEDLVRITRCKDCEYAQDVDCDHIACLCKDAVGEKIPFRFPDHYCGYGKPIGDAFCRFRFADGYECVAKGFSPQELRVEEDKHGKLLSKKKEAT